MKNHILFLTVLLLLGSCTPNDNIENSIDKLFSEFTEATPGASVTVIKRGEVIYQKGFGLADLDSKIKIEPKTNFRLASITKQFTALSILLLEDESKLSLSDPIDKFFPEFPLYGSKITVKNILQHTSGLPAYVDHMPDTLTLQLKDRDVLEIIMKQDSTYFSPGSEHRYSNTGYAILALIVEKVSGNSFAQFLQERIFIPLGMNNSVAFENGISTINNRAFGYAKSDFGFVFADQSLTSAVLGDGGIYSSTLDLIKWDSSFENETLLKREKLNASFDKVVLPSGETADYGYGWRLDPYKTYKRHHHTGGTSGFSNIYMKLPQLDLTVIILTNTNDFDSKGYAGKIADLFVE